MGVLDPILCAPGNGTTRRCTGQVGVTVLALNVLVRVTGDVETQLCLAIEEGEL